MDCINDLLDAIAVVDVKGVAEVGANFTTGPVPEDVILVPLKFKSTDTMELKVIAAVLPIAEVKLILTPRIVMVLFSIAGKVIAVEQVITGPGPPVGNCHPCTSKS
jgi:hypothetical protein